MTQAWCVTLSSRDREHIDFWGHSTGHVGQLKVMQSQSGGSGRIQWMLLVMVADAHQCPGLTAASLAQDLGGLRRVLEVDADVQSLPGSAG